MTEGAQAEVIRFLSDPANFGVDQVETVETHASRIFLAGERAFKLKQAVRYSYLDYSTVALREAACAAELAINRAFAPDLYLGTEKITRGPEGGLRLGGNGEAVDWVVVMRRFDGQAQLDHVAERGALTPSHMRALADRIAALHAAAELRPDHGGAAGIARAFELTAEDLLAERGQTFDTGAVDAWVGRARSALAAQAALLDRRRAEGKVRACHGDLHLRNICLLDDAPVPFDAIEFDERFSAIDVLYDIAFLLMDLHARGLDPLGNTVFNRYLDQTDEAAGLPALPLFMSLRAAIRAQVDAAAARRTECPQQARALRAEAVRYLSLAGALIEDGAAAMLVAVGGLSGTGKSTMAYGLAPPLGRVPGARVLRSDVVRKRLAGVALEAALPAVDYTTAARERVYDAMLAETRRCLEAGQAVIADANWTGVGARAALAGLGVRFQGIWLEVEPAERLRRVRGRVADASDATEAVARSQQEEPAPPGWRVVAAGDDPASVLRRAQAALAT